MNLNVILLTTAGGILAAVITDLDAYVKALEKDPKASFKWKLAFVRWMKGGLAAAAAGAGFGSMI